MNLVDITLLINSPQLPADMLIFYTERRHDLVAKINKNLMSIDLPEMTMREMLNESPQPFLANTVGE